MKPTQQLAILRTHRREGEYEDALCFISAEHDFSKGPYQDTVGFAVGSNQEILEYENMKQGQSIRALDGRLRIEFNPELSPARPYITVNDGSVEAHCVSLDAAMAHLSKIQKVQWTSPA